MESNTHLPVLLNEVINYLSIKETDIIVDLTIGRAGHAKKILENIPKGFLVGFDKDQEAILFCENELSNIGNNFKLFHSDFKNIKNKLHSINIFKVNAIIADLGVSSPQLDNFKRGFSYSKDSQLDMRMDQNQKLNAHYIINNFSFKALKGIFWENAGLKNASQITNIIIKNRPINTTVELANIIRKNLPAFILRKKNPNKAIFQAIRIAVNDELNSLKTLLKESVSLLAKDGKLAIISFNSIEDRIVKFFFGQYIKNINPSFLPIKEEKKFFVKTIYPQNEEISKNRRSKSAKLRILKKVE